jgi:hypothetical protein
MLVNAATTSKRVSHAKTENSIIPLLPIFVWITSPIDLPLWRTDANNEPKSCTPPTNILPKTIHKSTGTHPKIAA